MNKQDTEPFFLWITEYFTTPVLEASLRQLACIEDFLLIELRLKHPQKYKKQLIPD